MEDQFEITNGINHAFCSSLAEAYVLGQHYATELQGEVTILVNGAKVDTVAPQPRSSKLFGEIPPNLEEMIADGYNPDAKDGDGDGYVQEGTKWERPV
jgi:hypothetical protein